MSSSVEYVDDLNEYVSGIVYNSIVDIIVGHSETAPVACIPKGVRMRRVGPLFSLIITSAYVYDPDDSIHSFLAPEVESMLKSAKVEVADVDVFGENLNDQDMMIPLGEGFKMYPCGFNIVEPLIEIPSDPEEGIPGDRKPDVSKIPKLWLSLKYNKPVQSEVECLCDVVFCFDSEVPKLKNSGYTIKQLAIFENLFLALAYDVPPPAVNEGRLTKPFTEAFFESDPILDYCKSLNSGESMVIPPVKSISVWPVNETKPYVERFVSRRRFGPVYIGLERVQNEDDDPIVSVGIKYHMELNSDYADTLDLECRLGYSSSFDSCEIVGQFVKEASEPLDIGDKSAVSIITLALSNALPNTRPLIDVTLCWCTETSLMKTMGYKLIPIPYFPLVSIAYTWDTPRVFPHFKPPLLPSPPLPQLGADEQFALMNDLIEEVEEVKLVALQEHEELQRSLSIFFTSLKARDEVEKKPSGTILAMQSEGVEKAKRYNEARRSVYDLYDKLEQNEREMEQNLIELQKQLDAKTRRSDEVASWFYGFKQTIAETAEYSQSGKTIRRDIIAQFDELETKQEKELARIRQVYIKLQSQLSKQQEVLRKKERLGEGLHLIDFEQLKIENQTQNEKIEERNEDIHKLKNKIQETVQILTHVKEKEQYVEMELAALNEEKRAIEEKVNLERAQLGIAKKKRDALKSTNIELRHKQGFVVHDPLVVDYEYKCVLARQHYICEAHFDSSIKLKYYVTKSIGCQRNTRQCSRESHSCNVLAPTRCVKFNVLSRYHILVLFGFHVVCHIEYDSGLL